MALDVERDCPAYKTQACSSVVEPAVSRGKTATVFMGVLAGVGVGGIALGATLLFSRPDSDRKSGAVVLTPFVGPSLAGASITGSF